MSQPKLYIIAGPNGAGKTTFAREFFPRYADCKQFVNADFIAGGLAPFSPETAALKAGRLLLKEIRLLANRKADFGFETTLSGVTYVSGTVHYWIPGRSSTIPALFPIRWPAKSWESSRFLMRICI